MHIIDISIFILYTVVMLGIGFFFLKRNSTTEDYFVGGRSMKSWHIGLSVVATDVGGGFSIGLGGLGFTMGLSGSWMLFTGLIGAWLSAVLLIPTISRLSTKLKWLTFPQVFGHFFSREVAFLAALISVVGYLGFTSSQILAGAKLASASFPQLSINSAVLIMGIIAVVYTVMGGLKAVIYTDTVQWIILMAGLIFVGLPVSYFAIGGIDAIKATLPQSFLRFDNLSWQDLVNWFITIVPIWFVGMTLYQRIYASRDEKQAKKAWFIAGLFEWPVMALMGVILGLFSRVALDQGLFVAQGYDTLSSIDAEMGLPLLLRNVLPAGLMGLTMSAYFSAVLSTADSCLMAASGNLVTDIILFFKELPEKKQLQLSQITTLLLGAAAITIAVSLESVLDLMLHSYAFMVSGLFVPVIGFLAFKKRNATAAFFAMLTGGLTTVTLIVSDARLPLQLDANVFGITVSALVFLFFQFTGIDFMTGKKTDETNADDPSLLDGEMINHTNN
ncbi:sodium:solute symporter family protein [bacterium]|nr:sodium:solute symporter family protein [bacterium]